jgi:hypothetical protein
MSNVNEDLKVTGELKIVVTDEDGNVKQEHTVPNLVVTAGRNFIASRMVGTTQGIMSHMAVGSGTTAPALSQTTLVTQLGSRNTLSTSSVSGNVVTYAATFGAGQGTGAVTEAGVFNAATGGTMLCRTTFAVINKGANDTLAITWTVTIN